jgi:hypothetical protein
VCVLAVCGNAWLKSTAGSGTQFKSTRGPVSRLIGRKVLGTGC